MDSLDLKRAIATNTGFNQTAYLEFAASQEELNSMSGKEAGERDIFRGGHN